MTKRSILSLLLFLGLAATAMADMTPPTPPPIPGGFADANGQLGFFPKDGGGIEAVDLENGHMAWTSELGSWPLFSRYGWLAVAGLDQEKNHLRVRFLKPNDGQLIAGSAPITYFSWTRSAQDVVADGAGIGWGNREGYIQFQAWSERPQRPGPNRSRRAGFLQLRWTARAMRILGIQPPVQTAPPQKGLLWIDPATGKIEKGNAKSTESFGDVPPKLPKNWKREKVSYYWNWSDYGSAWSDKPRSFWVSPGVAGFFYKEAAEPHRLMLFRWRPYEKIPALSFGEGGECVPLVSLDGRFMILAEYRNGKDHYRLYDLAFAGKGPLAELPIFDPGVLWRFAVKGDLLFYVAEEHKPIPGGGTQVERRFVALDWRKGQVRWRLSLASRYEAPPVPGAR